MSRANLKYPLGTIAVGSIALFLWPTMARGDPPPSSNCELASFTGSGHDNFGGGEVRLNEDSSRLIIGAPQDNEHGTGAGAVYIYRRDGVGWTQEAKLTAWDAQGGDYFGFGIAISGDRVAVGSPRHGWGGQGKVYVYQILDGEWMLESEIMASDGSPLDYFGTYLDLQGDRLVVSAYVHSHENDWEGAAYVFEFDGATWVETAELRAADSIPYLMFGAEVVLDGDVIATGAVEYGYDYNGAAYVFRFDGSTWNQEAKLVASPSEPSDYFYHVAIDGDLLTVGADQRWGTGPGFVEVFRHDGAMWNREARLTASDGDSGDCFCRAAIQGDRMFVGKGHYAIEGYGAVYEFLRDGLEWNQVNKITPSDNQSWDLFGSSVSVKGDFLAVGAGHWMIDPPEPGKAYVFAIGPDCNQSGVADACDIRDGVSEDQNNDMIPDECQELCVSDVNNDGTVDPLDAGFVQARFGCIYPDDGINCLKADANADGEVDPLDVGFVMARFGACP